jgi:hypothetical protein
MALPRSIIKEPWEVNKRLKELGLEESILINATQRGWVALASCTRNHPPSFPGIYAWGETICSLGEQLIPLGWERVDESMWPLIINRDRTIGISSASGNDNTGSENDPLTSSAKGPKTQSAILVNQRQLVLFDQFPPKELLERVGRATWLLLVYRDISKRQMRSELSRPISMGSEGKVNGWAERIILAPQELDGIPEILLGGGNGPQGPEVTVDIKRRA